MNRESSLLLVVDVQEKLVASMPDSEALVATIQRLLGAARQLGVPICATEHFPNRIGSTVKTLNDHLLPDQIVQKVHFSAALEDGFQTRLQQLSVRQIMVCGTEAHICVLQTALALSAQGYDTFLVCDASSSRHPSDRDAAFQRASHSGVHLVTSEMVLFEWMKRADIPEFRSILSLIKTRP